MCMSNLCVLVSASAASTLQKRVREEELESTAEVTESTQDDLNEPPMAKKICFIQRVGLEVRSGGKTPKNKTLCVRCQFTSYRTCYYVKQKTHLVVC